MSADADVFAVLIPDAVTEKPIWAPAAEAPEWALAKIPDMGANGQTLCKTLKWVDTKWVDHERETLSELKKRLVCAVSYDPGKACITPARSVARINQVARIVISKRSKVFVDFEEGPLVCEITAVAIDGTFTATKSDGTPVPNVTPQQVLIFRLPDAIPAEMTSNAQKMWEQRRKSPPSVSQPRNEDPVPDGKDADDAWNPANDVPRGMSLIPKKRYLFELSKDSRIYIKTGVARSVNEVVFDGDTNATRFPPGPTVQILRCEVIEADEEWNTLQKDVGTDVASCKPYLLTLEGVTALETLYTLKFQTSTNVDRGAALKRLMSFLLSVRSIPDWEHSAHYEVGQDLLRDLRIKFIAFKKKVPEFKLRETADARRHGKDELETIAEKLQTSSRPTRPQSNGQQRFTGFCNHCGIKGHRELDCSKKKAGLPKGSYTPYRSQGNVAGGGPPVSKN